jgi:hypothetical protein
VITHGVPMRLIFLALILLGAQVSVAQLVITTTHVAYFRGPCDKHKTEPPASVTPLQASGGSGSYTWTVVAGTFPPGMTLNSDGTWGGIVNWEWAKNHNQVPYHSVTVEVTDTFSSATAQGDVTFYFTTTGLGGN